MNFSKVVRSFKIKFRELASIFLLLQTLRSLQNGLGFRGNLPLSLLRLGYEHNVLLGLSCGEISTGK